MPQKNIRAEKESLCSVFSVFDSCVLSKFVSDLWCIASTCGRCGDVSSLPSDHRLKNHYKQSNLPEMINNITVIQTYLSNINPVIWWKKSRRSWSFIYHFYILGHVGFLPGRFCRWISPRLHGRHHREKPLMWNLQFLGQVGNYLIYIMLHPGSCTLKELFHN